jgi:hypothetical protein
MNANETAAPGRFFRPRRISEVFTAGAAVAGAEALESRLLLSSGVATSGRTIPGTISSPGELDTYTFPASAGNAITVTIGQVNPGFDSFSPRIDLFAPDGTLIQSISGGQGASIDTKAGATGTFTVVARDDNANEGGDYGLTVAVLPGTQDAGGDAGPVSSGQARGGVIAEGDLDVFTFSAAAGNAITVAMGQVDAGFDNFDPRIDLYAPDGTLLKSASGAQGTSLDVRATKSGTYYAVARDDNGNEGGAYGLTVAVVPGSQNSGGDAGPIASGQAVAATIADGDLDVFTFNATANSAITVAMGQVNAGFDNFDPRVDVYGPDGTLLKTASGAQGTALDARAPRDGTYYVVARDDNGNEGGDYGLTVVVVPGSQNPGGDAGSIASGQTVSATIADGDLDVFTFTAAATAKISVGIGQIDPGFDNFDPRFDLYAPDGTLVKSVSGAQGATTDVTAPSSGTYYVVARDDNGNEGGRYELSLSVIQPPKPTVSVTATDASAAEAALNTGTFTFTRTDVGRSSPLTLKYTVGGTATRTNDYQALTGTVTIPAGALSTTVRVTPVDDATAEPTETVIVTVATSDLYIVDSSRRSGTVNIADNDTTMLGVTATDAAASESAVGPASTGAFTLRRSRATTAPLKVTLGVSGSAALNTDYRLTVYGATATLNTTTKTLTLTLAPGSGPVRIIVEVINDSAAESTEAVTLTLKSGSGYTVNPARAGATVKIADSSAE